MVKQNGTFAVMHLVCEIDPLPLSRVATCFSNVPLLHACKRTSKKRVATRLNLLLFFNFRLQRVDRRSQRSRQCQGEIGGQVSSAEATFLLPNVPKKARPFSDHKSDWHSLFYSLRLYECYGCT